MKGWVVAILTLFSSPGMAEVYGANGFNYPSEFVHPYTNPVQAQRILSYPEVSNKICKAYKGALPFELGRLKLTVGCNLFLYAGLIERTPNPSVDDGPFEVYRLATTLEESSAALLIWEPLSGLSPHRGAPIFPENCQLVIAAYGKCEVASDSPHTGEWDFYIRRVQLGNDKTINSLKENHLKCVYRELETLCEFFDVGVHVVEVKVKFRANHRDIVELIGTFRLLQQRARVQTAIRLVSQLGMR